VTQEELRKMKKFEKQMRKYYPKSSRFFSHGSYYEPRCGDNFKNPNSLVAQRYKRGFFRSFYADLTRRVPEPSKIPQNLQALKIFVGSNIVLRKLIKQNKKLKHVVLESETDQVNAKIIKYLKYSKNLCSIKFERMLPYFSEMQCKKMLRTWGKTLENFDSCGKISIKLESDHKSFIRAMETILMFPKLKMFQFNGVSCPFEKLQERNIAYNIKFRIFAFNSLLKKFPQSKPAGNVTILMESSYGKSNKMSLETLKFQKRSNQTLSLDLGRFSSGSNHILPVFQNISSLDLIIPINRFKFECSSLGQLNNLIHLSVEIDSGREKGIVGDFFRYLNKNVAPHQKLETFLITTNFEKNDKEKDNGEEEEKEEEEEKAQKSDAIVNFFEACSQTLKKVHFEFQYIDPESEDPELYYQGLSKLENLQSLSLFLIFTELEAKEQVNKLCEVISGMKSLKELDFKLLFWDCQEKQVNLTFPPQLKKLSVGMDTSLPSFNTLKTIGPLTNLTHLELVFLDFSSPKWGKILCDIIDKIKGLEVLVLKKRGGDQIESESDEENENENRISSQMKERLDKFMKESSNLKLIIFADMSIKEIIVLKRNYSWLEINPIIDDLSFRKKDMKINYIKSYM